MRPRLVRRMRIFRPDHRRHRRRRRRRHALWSLLLLMLPVTASHCLLLVMRTIHYDALPMVDRAMNYYVVAEAGRASDGDGRCMPMPAGSTAARAAARGRFHSPLGALFPANSKDLVEHPSNIKYDSHARRHRRPDE